MRFGIVVATALSACLWASAAQADIVAFQYEGPGCSTSKCNFGMAPGDTIDATLYFDSSSLPNVALTTSDLIDFSITAGTFHMTLADATAYLQFSGLYDLSGVLDGLPGFPTGSADKILVGSLFAAQALSPDSGPIADLGHLLWEVGYGSYDGNGFGFDSNDYYAAGTTQDTYAVFSRVVSPAPEPMTVSLLAAGLLGLGFRRRR